MNKFKYIKFSKNKKIRYLTNYQRNHIYIVFLHGFMSDIEGSKPSSFYKFAKKNGFGFLAIEYSGHGKSSGKFTNGNISKWSNEVKILIKKEVRKNDLILIGSSMGAWLALKQFKFFEKQIKEKQETASRNRPKSKVTSHQHQHHRGARRHVGK